ncbi:hypothetical protein TNCV_2463401 [Trichonephila clavipes]|nr:hypothetical protein TNCV_2463401 [Trichonephila clavipes]
MHINMLRIRESFYPTTTLSAGEMKLQSKRGSKTHVYAIAVENDRGGFSRKSGIASDTSMSEWRRNAHLSGKSENGFRQTIPDCTESVPKLFNRIFLRLSGFHRRR